MVNKSFRVRTNIDEDSVLKVPINQDYNTLDILSMSIETEGLYKIHTSDYGCIAGRVLANGNFGIPNAKISIFIEARPETKENEVLSYLYPYRTTMSMNENGVRYNLLPEDKLSDCHQNVGTFPSKRMVLDDNNVLEIYDEYYKFTTRTNSAGDFMIFGVPVGNQTIHMDIDLSDIGILSQKPRDMVYKGYNITQFENANMFKKSTNLDSLAQIISQNHSVYVYPFWGDDSESEIAITRKDFNVAYEFTPTCVFMGSVVTDQRSNGLSKKCVPSERMGKMDSVTTGKGRIEMIRKTQDGQVEELIVQGDELIDGNGTWCYQIPMNLDYVKTDEYGNIVPTDDPKKGIPTRAEVRFRFSMIETGAGTDNSHFSKVLVPMNPNFITEEEREAAVEKAGENKYDKFLAENGSVLDYAFGSATDDKSFKNLFWNNVYTVKSFIPRIQKGNSNRNKRFTGFKAVNVAQSNNPVPYNNMRVDLTFMFTLQCAIFKMLMWIVGIANKLMTKIMGLNSSLKELKENGRCLYIGDGYCPQLEGWYFAPNCDNNTLKENTIKSLSEDTLTDVQSVDYQNGDYGDEDRQPCLTTKIDYFVKCVEMDFAQEYDVIQFDFYNDWMNGMLYLPRWVATIRKKRKLSWKNGISVTEKINACTDVSFRKNRNYTQQCALTYDRLAGSQDITNVTTENGCTEKDGKQKCHKAQGRKFKKIFKDSSPGGGLIHPEQTLNSEYVYYLRPCDWFGNTKANLFATDIVLLGSLEKQNEQGIPQSFLKLPTSTYQMPDTVASTNLGVEGGVFYGTGTSVLTTLPGGSSTHQAGGGTPVITKEEEGVKGIANSFKEILANIDKRGPNSDYVPSDEEELSDGEVEVTEAAGIDWGYSGPNQGANNYEKLYYPGGHFLGISCFNAETNIKSCVNLSRICEAGAMMSQRQAIPKKNKNGDYSYVYLRPTGLISGDDVNDYGFRNEFATMNFNNLYVRRNNENFMEYVFEPLFATNFLGELKNKVNYTGYTDLEGISEADDGNKTLFARTIEENSHDYYRFRFGLHGDYTSADAKNKYLIKDANERVSMPMYDNSFYFYFGLHNGSTALDRLFSDYFAECPALKDFTPSVYAKGINAEYCSGEEGSGSIYIKVKNVIEPRYRIMNGDKVVKDITVMDTTETTVADIPIGYTYTVEVYGDGMDEIITQVDVNRNIPSGSEDVRYVFTNYTREFGEGDIISEKDGEHGWIDIDITNAVEKDLIYLAVITPDASISDDYRGYVICKPGIETPTSVNDYKVFGKNGTELSVSAWVGNKNYVLYGGFRCQGSENTDIIQIASKGITMPLDLDLLFGFNPDATYNKQILRYFEEQKGDAKKRQFLSRWYKSLIPSMDESIKYSFEKALFFQNSMCVWEENGSITEGRINCQRKNGKAPINSIISGNGERFEGDGLLTIGEVFNSPEEAAARGYVIDLDVEDPMSRSAKVPTCDSVLLQSYGYFYGNYEIAIDAPTIISQKEDYTVAVSDAKDRIPSVDTMKLSIPLIYRPFFFHVVFSSMYGSGEGHVSLAVANGITIGNKFKEIKINGVSINDNYLKRNGNNGAVEDDYDKNTQVQPEHRASNIEQDYPTLVYNSGIKINSTQYTVSVKESAPDVSSSFAKTIERKENIMFIGDNGQTIIDDRVRYFNCPKVLLEKMFCTVEDKTFHAYAYTSVNGKLRISYTKDLETEDVVNWNTYNMVKYKEYGGASGFTEIYADDIVNHRIEAVKGDYVVGIYDSDYESQKIDIGKEGIGSLGKVRPCHVNSISVIRIYNKSDFINLI